MLFFQLILNATNQAHLDNDNELLFHNGVDESMGLMKQKKCLGSHHERTKRKEDMVVVVMLF